MTIIASFLSCMDVIFLTQMAQKIRKFDRCKTMGSASEYERKRLENIKKNEEILLKLGLNAGTNIREVKRSTPSPASVDTKSDAKRQKGLLESYLPKRRSSRNQKPKNEKLQMEEKEASNSQENDCVVHMEEEEEEIDALIDLETWCEMKNIQPGPLVDGLQSPRYCK